MISPTPSIPCLGSKLFKIKARLVVTKKSVVCYFYLNARELVKIEKRGMGRHGSDTVMRKQLCGIIFAVFFMVGVSIAGIISIMVALPSMNESAAAPVEMNNDMKKMKLDGLHWFNANVRNKFPSNQATMTATQIVDLIDKGHGIGVKINTVLNAVPTEALASGVEAGFGILEKVNLALSKDGSDDLGADLHRILNQGATWMEAVDIAAVQSGVKSGSGILLEVNRLAAQIPSDHFKDMLHRVHSLLRQADADKIIDHVSQLGDGIAKVLARLNSKDGLTIKL